MKGKIPIFTLILIISIVTLFLGGFISVKPLPNSAIPVPQPTLMPSKAPSKNFRSPMDQVEKRVTKKKFGTFITSQNSPIQPERFSGFHTGVDFETFPGEQNTPVTIKAVCTGQLKLKNYTSGYGGVVVQECQLENSPLTILYGHLKLPSISKNIGDTLDIGETLGTLGEGYTSETDGERKHLHLGFYRGTEINLRGYVNSETELSSWLDPCLYSCQD